MGLPELRYAVAGPALLCLPGEPGTAAESRSKIVTS